MERVIREVGIIPFFPCAIPGYSIQELTHPDYWFGGDKDSLGPWDWKISCIQSGDIAYGKFLCGGKASFATVPLYRELMNMRRAVSEPDEKGRRIMEQISSQGSISMKEVRALLNVKKAAADSAMAKLEHQCRVVVGDIMRRYDGPYLTYKGWQVSSFCMPESLFENDFAASQFPGFPFAGGGQTLHTNHTPEESLEVLIKHISSLFPSGVSRGQILKVLK